MSHGKAFDRARYSSRGWRFTGLLRTLPASRSRGQLLADHVYWQSTVKDEVVAPEKETSFETSQTSWADFRPLNNMPRSKLSFAGSGNTPTGVSRCLSPSRTSRMFLPFS